MIQMMKKISRTAKISADKTKDIDSLKRTIKILEDEVANYQVLLKRQCDEYGNGVTNSGTSYDHWSDCDSSCQSCGESGTNWWVFDGGLSDRQIMNRLVKLNIIEDTDRGAYDDNDWDCSGQCMIEKPIIKKRTARRVLVTQGWGLDV